MFPGRQPMTVSNTSPTAGATADPALFRRLRNTEFPWTAETIYFNNAAIGPLPERTRRALEEFTAKRAAPHLLDERDLFAELHKARTVVAQLINASTAEIGLAVNTSFGLNLAARSLPLRRGDTVLVSDQEFPANVYPWLALGRQGVRLERVPTTAEGWPDQARLIERVHDPDVRVLSISLVQFATGFQVDVGRLSQACRDSNCFLVIDGIQGIGQVPFDVRATRVDIVACGGQKWLLSPWGSGFVYVRRELLELLEPVVVGWMAFEGTDDNTHLTDYGDELRCDARRFELNTLPFQDFVAMSTSVELLLEVGVEQIARRLCAIREPILERVNAGRLQVISPIHPPHSSGIVSVKPRRPAEAYHRLKTEHVVCAMREGAIRLAPHCYNTVEEMEKVADVIEHA